MSKERYSYEEVENAYHIKDNEQDKYLNVPLVVNKLNYLEAKLAESKEQVEIVEKQHSELLMTIFNGHKENFELKQQLAEKEKAITAYEKIVEQKDEELGFANRDKTYIVKQLNDPSAYVSLEDYKRIEQQLAEKEKEIEKQKQNVIYTIHIYSDEFVEKDKELKELRYKVKCADQSKIEFAIEKLQRVKEICDKKFDWWEKSEFEGDIYDKLDVSNAYLDVSANVEEIIKELEGKTNEQN